MWDSCAEVPIEKIFQRIIFAVMRATTTTTTTTSTNNSNNLIVIRIITIMAFFTLENTWAHEKNALYETQVF